MNTHWTYAKNWEDWTHEAYPTKKEAIKEGKLTLDGSFFVGQLFGNDEKLAYLVDNIEEIDQ